MNGVIELDESSDSDGDVPDESKPENNNEKPDLKDIGLKKEETLAEEKIIMDDVMMNSGDSDSDKNLFSTDANNHFSFTFDDKLPENILDDSNILDVLDKDPAEREMNDSPNRNKHFEIPKGTSDVSSIRAELTVRETEDNFNRNADEQDHNVNEETSETFDAHDSEQSKDTSTAKRTDSVTDYAESENHFEENIEDCERESATSTKDSDESEKDGKNKEADYENTEKRPSSRESTTSTASSSSERITIRSTTQLNQLVPANANMKIKTEKETADKTEKPGLSVLNPSQLGASNNTSVENLLQSNNFVTSAGDQMLGFLPSGMSTQCDVCESQFADSVSLDEHKVIAGHYKCLYSPECATFVFPTLAEFSSHQQTVHGIVSPSPVQQLAHQVQSIPMRYQMDQPGVPNNYQTAPGFPTANQSNRGIVPQMLGPSQNNVSVRQYNVAGAPRIGGVRSVLPPSQVNPMKRGVPPPQQPSRQLTPSKRRCIDNFSNRNGDMDCKFVSVQKPDNTDDVVAQLSKSITITARQETQKKNDTVAVANMLANRGITVSSVPSKVNKNNPVAMLNLNSAVSLIPTSACNTQNRQNSGFAVPHSRIAGTRQSVPGQVSQTVDLTGPEVTRNRPIVSRAASKFTCRICDRPFLNQDQLNQHMTIHRSGPKKQLPFKCPNCAAQYPNQQALMQHRQICRRDVVSGTNEMVIPIVDLKQPGALQRLQSVGISHMIPLNALGSQAANGTFGIPILAFSSDRVTNTNMANVGISNILPVGPLRRL